MPPRTRQEFIDSLMEPIDQKQDPELYQKTLQDFQQASDQDLSSWYNQQNDPGQVEGNQHTANVENEAYADLTEPARNSFPEMSEEAKDEVLQQISEDFDDFQNQMEQHISDKLDPEPELEQ